MPEGNTWRCAVDGCERAKDRKAAKGMCGYHYKKQGPRSPTSRAVPRACAVAGCDRMTRRRFCSPHALERFNASPGPICAVGGCRRRASARGWCEKHYRPYAKYGLSPEANTALLEAQGGGCAICGITASESPHPLVVDHDHSCCPGKRSCGKCVRGILCRACNVALGNLNDEPRRVLSAYQYLVGHA